MSFDHSSGQVAKRKPSDQLKAPVMKTAKGLLVSFTVTLLMTLTITAPRPERNDNLNSVVDLIKAYNQEIYVDNVHHLTEGPDRCGEEFFCTVHNILHKNRNATNHRLDAIVRNLAKFNELEQTNCTEVLETVPSTSEKIQLPEFFNYLTECIRCRNLLNSTTSC